VGQATYQNTDAANHQMEGGVGMLKKAHLPSMKKQITIP